MINVWFPTAIYFEPNILNDNLSSYEKEIKNAISDVGTIRDGLKNIDSTHKTRNNIFEVCELKGLRKVIYESSKAFLKEIGYLNLDNLHFDNCWANISYPGDYIFPHNHNGSLLSGVYYVKSSINERIKFFNKPTMLPDPEVWNNYNHQYCEYSCIPGSMLLFTSDTMHGTEKQKCEEKIALSFNLSL